VKQPIVSPPPEVETPFPPITPRFFIKSLYFLLLFLQSTYKNSATFVEHKDVKFFHLQTISKGRQYLISILFVLLVSAACYLISGWMGYRVTAFILLVTVSVIAALFDIFPVLLSALLSAVIWNFFFIPPRLTFQIHSGEDLSLFLMYFLIASVNAVLTYKIRELRRIAAEEEKKASTVILYNTLLNSLSHELRTPISTIIGATDNLLNDKEKLSAENATKLIVEISRASLRLNRQVENLLNMSRLESGFIQARKDWCDVQELIYSAVHQLDELLSNHTIEVQVAEGLPLVKLDFGLIQQVLTNLLGNAALYTPEKSQIILRADIIKKEQKEFLHLRVSDNGPGVPQPEHQQIFEKFYRPKNSRTGGTGLGLSIAKGFIEAHEGRISFQNQPGGGATFLIELPAETSYLSTEK
jgi:two-component system, OmpR family, sensor histidine kinase KdpD